MEIYKAAQRIQNLLFLIKCDLHIDESHNGKYPTIPTKVTY